MITGAQIRRGRELLRWQPSTLAVKAHLATSTVQRAESVDEEPPITVAQQATIRLALEAAGIEFADGKAGVTLRKKC
jgi:hypothetical protein